MRYFHPAFYTIIIFSLMATATHAASTTILPCKATNVTLYRDDQDGLYDGMSQSGTSLVLLNSGPTACALPAMPLLTFSHSGQKNSAAQRGVSGMHPGPVLLPRSLGVGQRARIVLRWFANDVFEAKNCIHPAFVSLSLAASTLRQPFNRTMCAPAGQTGYFTQYPADIQ